MNRNAHEGIEDPNPSYLSQHHHVLHDKGNVEQRRKTVEEVKLGGEEWRSVKGKSCFRTAMVTSSGVETHHQYFQDQVILIGGLQPVIF